jgi:hypothetical protein
MSTIANISSSLSEASDISKLNGPDDWVVWNRTLKGHLSMIDLWDILTGADIKPDEKIHPTEAIMWSKHQKKLNGLLILIIGPSALSIIEMNASKTVTKLYQLLKAEYNTLTLTTFSILYRKIFRCSLANYKTLREYFDDVVRARNKLKELSDLVSEMIITKCFLDGLDSSYND